MTATFAAAVAAEVMARRFPAAGTLRGCEVDEWRGTADGGGTAGVGTFASRVLVSTWLVMDSSL